MGGARRSDVACLGIDAEALGSVTAEVFDVLFVESERVAIAQGIDPTTLFCCKEAVYKAVYPAFREFFDFADLAVTADATRFRARPRRTLRSESAILAGEGHILQVADHVLACFCVRG